MELRPAEIRVLACLLEKQHTTPDSYPLTLNSLRLACNQATNRDPVVDYDDDTIRDAVHRLERRGLARLASGAGSRAPKFRHLLSDRLPIDDGEQALLCVLMLRGPQTPGELKQRSDRLHAFSGLDAVEDTLGRLVARELVASQPRRPGQKEQRFAHRLGAEEDDESPGEPPAAAGPDGAQALTPGPLSRAGEGEGPGRQRLEDLAQRVARLERDVAELREALGG
jgi:uncharacterized protein YceH (UPF0502 family)